MKKLLLLVVAVIVVALAFPVLNLVIKPDNSGVIASLCPGDPDFAPVAAVLEAKCAGCHVPGAELPFYASFPIASSMIQADIEKGLRWLDLSKDLSSENAPVSEVALAKLEYVVEQGSMPPGKYTALHWDASLSGDDVALITGWVEKTRAKHFATGKAATAHANEPVQPLVPIEGLDPKVQAPFFGLLKEAIEKSSGQPLRDAEFRTAVTTTIEIVDHIKTESARVGFWRDPPSRQRLENWVFRSIRRSRLIPNDQVQELAIRYVDLAKSRHRFLVT